MAADDKRLATLVAKDEIRDLAMLYSRGIDRQDYALLRTLYTSDGTDDHGDVFTGSASGFIDGLEVALPTMRYTGHHICNHLISVAGDEADGEVYCIAYHVIPDGDGGFIEDLMLVRYLDRYRREEGRWRFAARTAVFDLHNQRPIDIEEAHAPDPAREVSVTAMARRLFAQGPQ